MAKKMPSKTFVQQLAAALNRHDGYIMGATGQDPRKWAVNSWWYTQYTNSTQRAKALYWREHAARVWDCNGLAEGLYKDHTGVDINARARNNFAEWCGQKGTGMIPAAYRVPGAAVFWGDKASTIHHVAYLYKPVKEGKPGGDWYLIEARGVLYGVVMTKLNDRKPQFWGLMTKYFDYDSNADLPTPAPAEPAPLQKGDKGAEVKAMQKLLLKWDAKCLPKYGADGDFGSETLAALKAYQKAIGVPVTGIYDAATKAALEGAKPVWGGVVQISGGNCYIRTEPDVNGRILGVANAGEKLNYAGETAANGWIKVTRNGVTGWVSGKYGKVVSA